MTGDGVHHALKRESHSMTSPIAEEFLQQGARHRSTAAAGRGSGSLLLAPLVSLGREIDNIDNLFVSPNGRITLVETKF